MFGFGRSAAWRPLNEFPDMINFPHQAWLTSVGAVMINGYKAQIIGSICMDFLMVDISICSNVTFNLYSYIFRCSGKNTDYCN